MVLRVVVGDDHPMFRDAVSRALTAAEGIAVVAEASDGAQALAAIREYRPDVAVLDFRMPRLNGGEVAAAVAAEGLPTRVLILSGQDETALVLQVIEAGAAGFLPKETSRAEIVTAVRDCAAGKDVLAPGAAAALVTAMRRRADTPVLTPREAQVLRGIAEGKSVPAMASELYLATSTVKTHVQRLYEKLGVADRGAVVAAAMRRGLLR